MGIDTIVAKPASAQWGMPGRSHVCDRNDAHAVAARPARRRRQSPGVQALLAVGHRRGQALGRQQQEALVGLVGPAQRHAVGARDAPHALARSRRRARSASWPSPPAPSRRRAPRAARAFPRARDVFSATLASRSRYIDCRCSAMPLKHSASVPNSSLVTRSTRAPKSPRCMRSVACFRLPDGLQHEQVAGVEQHRGAETAKRHHRHLQQVQQRGPARHVALDAGDQRVDVARRTPPCRRAIRRAPTGGARRPLRDGTAPSRARRPRSAAARRRPTARTAAARGRRGAAASRLRSNSATCCGSAASSPVPTDSDIRYACMRMRPASFTAAAPPSSCHDTHSVSAIDSSASSRNGVPTSASFAPRLQCRGWLMRAL